MSSFFDQSSLCLIPSGYKDSKLYSVKPTDGSGDLTFSRGADIEATRINSQGLIEKAQVNLLLQSNTFSTTWTKYGGVTLTSGQTGYDGSSDAWLLTKPAAGFTGLGQSHSNTGVITGSFYLKAGTHTKATVRLIGTPDVNVIFDLANGVVFGGTATGWIARTITSIGNNWYRCSLTLNATASSTFIVYPDEITNTAAGTIYIQDAQLNYGLVAQDYVETTTAAVVSGITNDMPRLNYDPANPSCPSLLLEPSRLNKVKHSEFFDGWSNRSNCAFTSNYTVSPEGVQNASRLLFSSNGFAYDQSSQQSSATQYTLSCYAKRNDAGTQNVGFFVNGSGVVNSAWSLTSEWQRFTYTYISTNTVYAGIAGIAGADISVYGFQMEAGSYGTSLIPTYGTSATRTADACSKTGIASLIGQTEGTLFAEFDVPTLSGVGLNASMVINDGTSNNEIYLSYYSTGRVQAVAFVGGALEVNINLPSYGLTAGRHKFALAYKNNDYNFFIDGVSVGTDTSASVPSTSDFNLVNRASGGPIMNYNQALLFKTRLPNSDLANLTSL